MSSIKAKDTKPELLLRKALWAKGVHYRKNVKNIPGKPDIVFLRKKIAVFCDGDFWHGHNWALRGLSSFEEELNSYSDFWKEKLSKNVERDKKITDILESEGWLVLRIWESDIQKNIEQCVNLITDALASRENN